MSITQKIYDIQKSLTVKKSGWDERSEYAYYKAEDVANAVRVAMNHHGIIHRTRITDLREDNFYDTNGRNRPRVTFHATITLVDVEDGSEFSTDVVATGSDTGSDKATRKAMVQSFKEMAIDLFIITEEFGKFDSDSDKEAEPVATAPTKREQSDNAAALLKQLTDMVNDDANELVTGEWVGKIAPPIAAKHGLGKLRKDWSGSFDVLTEILKAAENGEVPD